MNSMNNETIGAWLLSQSRHLDNITGAARLENILYAGRIGRLYNLLRRGSHHENSLTIDADTIKNICALNNIDRSARENGIKLLTSMELIDESANGSIAILGATSKSVLEATAKIFKESKPSPDEEGSIFLSELISRTPTLRKDAEQQISDTFKITTTQSSSLIDICKASTIIDEANDSDRSILFNGNTFRNNQYASKTYRLLEALSSEEKSRIEEAKAKLQDKGAIVDSDLRKILGDNLYTRVMGIGLFDRLEVSNNTESIGYIVFPYTFQKYGRPFEEDPVDDAKALLASLTYGMTRSAPERGRIAFPDALLRKLIAGEEVGGPNGISAIGEDYRELEKRQVVQVIQAKASRNRFRMKLLKPDVGELALAIVRGSSDVAKETVLMDTSIARSFTGPESNRRAIRLKHTFDDNKFVASTLDSIRSGGM